MNERIKELAEQAREYARDHVAECKHYGYYMEHNEYELQFEWKFAELIVKECIEQIRFCRKNDIDFVETHVEKHFGVE